MSEPLDRHRPHLHFLPPANWLNDPNGLIWWRGQMHIFYQHNPNAPYWGDMHWGHAVSDDLINWRHLPLALAPTPGGPDADGCFSGCAVDLGDRVAIIYSGHVGHRELPCLAFADDDTLVTWTKYPGNPIITAPPDDLPIFDYRDHCIWREGDEWRQIIGAGIRDVGGVALLYRATDLRQWEYMHPLCVGDVNEREPIWTGRVWECPQLIDLGSAQVLLISVWDGAPRYTAMLTGSYQNNRFIPSQRAKLDYGDTFFYAPQATRDAQGRVVMWGWIAEGRHADASNAAGWAGALSLPRVLSATPAGEVHVTPLPELAQLRGREIPLPAHELGALHVLPCAGERLELRLTIDPGDATECRVLLRRAPDGSEVTALVYNARQGTFSIDARNASTDPLSPGDLRGGPLLLGTDERLELHIFLDHSILEVFAQQRVCITGRTYPTGEQSVGVALASTGGTARLLAGTAWELGSIWQSGAVAHRQNNTEQ